MPMRIWLSTSPYDFASEFDDIERMFDRGLTRLILQKRGRGTAPWATEEAYERWLLSLPMEARDYIWVRGTPNLAERLEVRGCIADVALIAGEVPESYKRINCIAFCNNLQQLDLVPAWASGVLIGPVFQPQSLMEPVEVLGVDALGKSLAGKDLPQVVAFGGIDHENLEVLKGLPLQGVSLLGGIWNYGDPVNAFIKIDRAVKSL